MILSCTESETVRLEECPLGETFLTTSAVSRARLSEARTYEFHQESREIRRLAVRACVNRGLLRDGLCPRQTDRPRKLAATANDIAAHETLFRLGIAAELVGQAGFMFVALALYDLLKGINRRHALLMVILIVSRFR